LYPHLVIGSDRLVGVRRVTSNSELASDQEPISLLAYARGSLLGRLSVHAQSLGGPVNSRLVHTNENAFAEALRYMVLEGHGMAWLPYSILERDLAEGRVEIIGADLPLEIRLYRNARKGRAAVNAVWSAAQTLCT
jgi:DNA-binding transcriptional LysR family regulator